MAWQIVVKPVGANPGKQDGKNEGGVVVELVTGRGAREEVKRVAFERGNSTNPDVPFDDQLDDTLKIARKACDVVNELLGEQGALV